MAWSACLWMVLGWIAGSVHDPEGVRSRGWVALVPTPVLVMIAPVDEVMREEGMGDEHGFVWEADPTNSVLREFCWRMFHGEINAWEGRWFFARVEKRYPDVVESIAMVTLPRMEGGDAWVDPRLAIEYWGMTPVSFMYPGDWLPSRMRLLGSEPGQWVHFCACTIGGERQRWSGFRGEGLERGRYIVEREYYLPPDPPSPVPNNWLPQGENIFVPERRLWKIRKEFVINDSRWMTAFDEPGIGEELVRQLDPTICVEEIPGGAYLSLRGLHAPVTDPPRPLAFGLEIKLVRDGRVISETKEYFESPMAATPMGPRAYDLSLVAAFNTSEGVHAGDTLTLVISGSERIAAERLYAPDAPLEYWSGEVIVRDLVVVSIPTSGFPRLPTGGSRGMPVTVPPMEE